MPRSAAHIPHPIPFLWVVGSQDPMFARGETYAFAKAPKHPGSRYLEVNSNHLNTPTEASAQIIDWLRSLNY